MALETCPDCGNQVSDSAAACPKCGRPMRAPAPRTRVVREAKSKAVAGILAIFLGGLGLHRFYLGSASGVLYLLFCWTFIPSIIALFEGLAFLLSSDEAWNAKYGATYAS